MNYNQKMELIRKYVDFSFKTKNRKRDFTRTQKWLITKYYNILYDNDAVLRTANSQFKAYKPKSKKEERFLKDLAGVKGKRIKRIPVPVLDEKDAKVKFQDGSFIIEENNVRRIINSWGDKDDNPINSETRKKLVNNITKKYADNTLYNIQAGNFEIKSIRADKENIERRVKQFQDQYQNHKEWLFGLVSYEFDNQLNFEEYIETQNKLKRKPKRKKPKTTKRKKKTNGKNNRRS